MGITRLDRIEAASGSSRRAVTITGYQDYGDYILFDGESAPRGGDVYVYYQAPHSVPTNSARGSYPEYLDDAVLIGISGYALKMRARAIQQDIADSSEEMIEEIKRLSGVDADQAVITTLQGGDDVGNHVYQGVTALIQDDITHFRNVIAALVLPDLPTIEFPDFSSANTAIISVREELDSLVDDSDELFIRYTATLAAVLAKTNALRPAIPAIAESMDVLGDITDTGWTNELASLIVKSAGRDTLNANFSDALIQVRNYLQDIWQLDTSTPPVPEGLRVDFKTELDEPGGSGYAQVVTQWFAELTTYGAEFALIQTEIEAMSDPLDDIEQAATGDYARAITALSNFSLEIDASAAAPDLTAIAPSQVSADDYLRKGDGLIEQFSFAGSPQGSALDYRDYARAKIELAEAWAISAEQYITIARTRLDQSGALGTQVNARLSKAQLNLEQLRERGRIIEAKNNNLVRRLEEIQIVIRQAETEQGRANLNLQGIQVEQAEQQLHSVGIQRRLDIIQTGLQERLQTFQFALQELDRYHQYTAELATAISLRVTIIERKISLISLELEPLQAEIQYITALSARSNAQVGLGQLYLGMVNARYRERELNISGILRGLESTQTRNELVDRIDAEGERQLAQFRDIIGDTGQVSRSAG